MIVNPGKFQAMIINRFGKMENKLHKMYVDNKKISSEHSVNFFQKLLLCYHLQNFIMKTFL